MPLSQELLDILVCPETKQPVVLAAAELLDSLNQHIQQGTLKNRAEEVISEPVDAALVREDGAFCYPIREDIPVMLVEEAIPLGQLGGSGGSEA